MAAALIDRVLHHCHIVNVRCNGSTSDLRGARIRSSPRSSPGAETSPGELRVQGDQVLRSSCRAISRMIPTPHTRSPATRSLNRSWENGMRNSALQPRESIEVATSHTASQAVSSCRSSKW
jgi:hypothetical protein